MNRRNRAVAPPVDQEASTSGSPSVSNPSLLANALLKPAARARATAAEGGTLGETPLPQLLAHLLADPRTGSLTLRLGKGEEHVIVLTRGAPMRVRTSLSAKSLRDILLEAKILDEEGLAIAEARAAENRVLLTHQLERDGVLKDETLRTFQAEQFLVKLRAVAALDDETRHSFFADPDPALAAPKPCDPLAAILATARVCADRPAVLKTLEALGPRRLVLHYAATLTRFSPNEKERAVLATLREKPTSYPELLASVGDDVLVRSLVYALVVTGHLDLGDGRWPLTVERTDVPRRPASHYEALGVPPNATAEQIVRAFSKFSAPIGDAEMQPGWFERFAWGVVAFRVLDDSNRRAAYDRALAEGKAQDDDETRRVLRAAEDYDRAEKLFDDGDLARAEDLALRAADGSPEPEHLALLARIMGRSANTVEVDRALAILDAVVAAAPTSDRALVHRGTILLRTKREQAAIRDFRAALEIDPSNVEALRALRGRNALPKAAVPASSPTPTEHAEERSRMRTIIIGALIALAVLVPAMLFLMFKR